MDVTLVDVVVVVDDPICSSREMHVIDGKKYEARVVLGMSRSPFIKPGHSKFQGVRYMKHSRHEKYYKQVRLLNAPVLVARDWIYDSSESPLDPDCNANGVFSVVTVLVKTKTDTADCLKFDLLQSLGSQVT